METSLLQIDTRVRTRFIRVEKLLILKKEKVFYFGWLRWNMKFLKFRDLLYDIFIYNLDITDCIWYILTNLIELKKIKKQNMSNILLKTYSFLKYYNNNYRPIYHLESYLFYLISIINGF
jgi:hypothetical protein